MNVTYHFDGGGSHQGKPACWGWVCYVEGIEYAHGCAALPPGTTNNVAEYEGFINAVEHSIAHDWQGAMPKFHFRGDSLLVINQVQSFWVVRDDKLRDQHWRAQRALALCGEHTLGWVPREENRRADELARIGRSKYREGQVHTWA